MKFRLRVAAAATWLCLSIAAHAHDTWVQTNINVVRMGDVVHIDLMLGNHGNEHRDFKLASKVDAGASTLEVIAPDGTRTDLKRRMTDTGLTTQEGFWTARYTATQPGLYLVAHTFDKVMSYAPERAIKSAKTFFVASASLERVPSGDTTFRRIMGHRLELVPDADPVVPMSPGTPMRVQLLYKGKPMANENVAFIPRGATLTGNRDSRYERTTDAQGRAQFTPDAANYYLVVAHHTDASEKGKGYDYTHYSATLTVYVPQIAARSHGTTTAFR